MWWNLPERTLPLSFYMESYWSYVVLESSQFCNTAITQLQLRLAEDRGTEGANWVWTLEEISLVKKFPNILEIFQKSQVIFEGLETL